MTRKLKKLSVVVPLLNESEGVDAFHKELLKNVSAFKDYEVIYVDDGSTDGTDKKLEALHKKNAQIKILRFSRNFGQNAALMAGINHASGDAVVCIDGDLQHPPSLLPKMVEAWEKGADIILPVASNWQSVGGYQCRNIIYPLLCKAVKTFPKPNAMGFFRLFDKSVADVIKQMPERPDFLQGMLSWTGFSTQEISYEVGKRVDGSSKWTTAAQLNKGIGSLCSFSLIPMRIVFVIGAFFALLGVLCSIFGLLAISFSALQWVVIALSFFSGLILAGLGIVGEYVGRSYHQNLNRPNYIISNKLGL